MNALDLLKTAAKSWINDNGTIHCAAIAYYTALSIAPLLIIAIAIAGFAFGGEASGEKSITR